MPVLEGVTGAEPERSRTLLAEAEQQFERDGDAWGPAVVGFVRMETAIKTGDPQRAVPLGRSTAAAFRRIDDAWVRFPDMVVETSVELPPRGM